MKPNAYTTPSASGIVRSAASRKFPPGNPDSAPKRAIPITNGGAPVMKLIAIACHGLASRTRPVALRTNIPDSAAWADVPVTDVATVPPLRLSHDELVADDQVVPQRDHDPVQAARVVLGPRIQRERPPDTSLSLRFVDVSVQREERLVLLDQLPDGVTADRLRHRLPTPVAWRQVRLQIRRRVESTVVRRHMQVEDRAAGILQLVGELLEAVVQRFLVQFSRAVPRRRVRVRGRDHLVWSDAHDAVVAEELRAERAILSSLDRDDRLAEQIAAHHRRVGLVELRRAEELPPQKVGAVDVRGIEEPYASGALANRLPPEAHYPT